MLAASPRPALKARARRAAKHVAIRAGLEGVAWSGAGRLFPQAAGRGVIFTLHHVRPAEPEAFSPNALLSVTPGFLEQAILAARECGLTPVALDDLPQLLANPADTRRFVSFTLDDGFRDNARWAAPVFRRHHVPFTVFVTQGFARRASSMWWETAEALLRAADRLDMALDSGPERLVVETPAQKQAAFDRIARMIAQADEDEAVARLDRAARVHGIDPLGLVEKLAMDERELEALAADPLARLGAHTLTHVNLRRVGAERLKQEIAGSAEAVERICGRRPASFAYPYGFAAAAGTREFDAAREAGFCVAVTTRPGVLTRTSFEQPTALPRVSLNGLFQQKRFVKALISGLPFRFM